MTEAGGKRPAVLISGCDSGFGRSLAEKLDASGKFLIFAGVFTPDGMNIYKGSKNVVPIPLDVTSDQSVQVALGLVRTELEVKSAFLYGLVNNAGILTQPGPTEWQDVKNYERMMSVNVYGVVRLTNAFLPMIRASQGRIVIIASIAGRVGLAFNSAYCASKYAITGYAEVLRRDMINWKVRVCVVEPGIFAQTGLYGDWQVGFDRLWENLDKDLKTTYGEGYFKHTRAALGQIPKALSNGSPEEVPNCVIDALTNPKPYRRYRPGRDSKTIFRALPLLPDHWVDAILTRPIGPPILPAALKERTASHDLYSNDLTASAFVTGLVMLSSVGVYTAGKTIMSRL